MWDLPGSGITPTSPALAGGFLTTEPPEKPLSSFLYEAAESSEVISPKLHSYMVLELEVESQSSINYTSPLIARG